MAIAQYNIIYIKNNIISYIKKVCLSFLPDRLSLFSPATAKIVFGLLLT